MKTAADKFESVDHDLGTMLSNLLSELEGLKSAWAGQSARSFDSVKTAFEENQRKLSSALRETASGVRSSGANYTASDQETASAIGNIAVPNLPI